MNQKHRDEPVVEVKNLSKVYSLYDSPKDRLIEALSFGHKELHKKFSALDNVNFTLRSGRTLGVLGLNGSGKSTLLKILTGVLTASSGEYKVKGQISSLLELGTGFNPELSGIDNIYFYGTIHGFTRKKMKPKVTSIAKFADIGYYLHQPVKTYSSGMYVRLAFACAIQIEPDILIIDEALAVGDAKFQAKCFNALRKFKDSGCTIILVTHSQEQIVTHCDEAILLHKGKIVSKGQPSSVVNLYMDLIFDESSSKMNVESVKNSMEKASEPLTSINKDFFSERAFYNPLEYRWGDKKASIYDYEIHSEGKEISRYLKIDKNVKILLRIMFHAFIENPIIGFTLKTKEGVTVCGSNTKMQNSVIVHRSFNVGEHLELPIFFKARLGVGDYFISLGVASVIDEITVPHDRRYDSIHLITKGNGDFFGPANLGIRFGG